MTAYISKQLNTKQPPLLLWVLLGFVIFFSLLYAYFLNMAVMSVIARQGLSQNIALVTSDVSGLEGRYTALEDAITPDKAAPLGLSSTPTISYVSDNSQPLLSLGTSIGQQ